MVLPPYDLIKIGIIKTKLTKTKTKLGRRKKNWEQENIGKVDFCYKNVVVIENSILNLRITKKYSYMYELFIAMLHMLDLEFYMWLLNNR